MFSLYTENSMSKILHLGYAGLVLVASLCCGPMAQAQNAFDDPGSRNQAGGAVGDLKPVVDKVEAGAVALGSATQVVVLFRNDDNKPVKTGAINLYPSSNITATVGENQCSTDAIQPGEVCALSIQVKGLQQGQYRIELLMRHDGRAKLLTSTINGTVEQTGDESQNLVSDIEMIPPELDFGSLTESRSQVKAVILRNKTSKPIKIEDLVIEAGSQSGFTMNSNCAELQVGQACVASVTWSPEQKGPSTGNLIVRHDGPTGVSTVELTGEYEPESAVVANVFPEAVPGKGLLISSQEQIDFGSSITQSSSITISLVNVGDVPLSLTGIRMTNAENGVRTENSGCQSGKTLAPLEACPLTLTWEPVREGSILDDLQVTHTGARGVLVMPLRGSALRGINKDKKAIMLGAMPGPDAILNNIQPLSLEDMGEDGDVVMEGTQKATISKPKNSLAAQSASPTAPSSASSPSALVALPQVDVRGALDGYAITSYSAKRAIVNGPGGSRVVFDGEQTVIGGILWEIKMRPGAVEFKNGSQQVLLLFDRSLSSFSVMDSATESGTSDGGNTATPAASSTTSTSNTTAR